ncbi:hypothetical protein JI739_00830 [Ramlibacter sp. AW1]|uniref:Porin n=1 Tax=Ramlibacter aurantiacus TaxID=2801330 RepID=A0A937CZZ5_9BURK|nr:hypothetical protein [Ramlibacter aurantiacus]
MRRTLVPLVLATAAAGLHAQTAPGGWQFGAVLDVQAASRELALGTHDKGLGLGHSDLTASGPLGRHLQGRVTAAAHSDDRRLEFDLEEAFAETRTLPAGLQLRAGRFASQIGYLNEQHPHADDFVQRPLSHRAFFGRHWVDDGLRLNWVAPTDLYLRLGAELFRGRGLVDEPGPRAGAAVLSARLGGDLGASQSWQAGLSFLNNRRQAAAEAHEGEHEGEDGEHELDDHAAHAHGASFSGRRMWLGDIAWKWAPGGNNARQQVRVAYERAVVRGLAGPAAGGRHVGDYLSAVWRFAPAWEVGARTSVLKARMAHDDHADDGKLRENAVMLAYRPTHAQVLRLQLTDQRDRGGFEGAARAVQLQYILNWGAHAAHTF